jgi:Fur family zinc uptake transcriptional regulator
VFNNNNRNSLTYNDARVIFGRKMIFFLSCLGTVIFLEVMALMALADEALKEALDQLAAKCAAKGGHLTSIRRQLLGILLKAEKPVKAYTLIEESARVGRRLTPATVYRVLGFLMEHGLVHKVNALNAFVACSESDRDINHQPLLLVCPSCQKTTEINDPDLATLVFAKLGSLGYSLKRAAIEVHGQCQLCSGE